MAKFIMLLHNQSSGDRSLSPAEIQAVIQEYKDWSQKMGQAGKLVGGEKLTDDGGKVLRAGGGDITDGPYSETKEVIGGYFVIEANDYDDAADIAQSCPHLKFGGGIELRQIDAV